MFELFKVAIEFRDLKLANILRCANNAQGSINGPFRVTDIRASSWLSVSIASAQISHNDQAEAIAQQV